MDDHKRSSQATLNNSLAITNSLLSLLHKVATFNNGQAIHTNNPAIPNSYVSLKHKVEILSHQKKTTAPITTLHKDISRQPAYTS
jgi:hypothetical protein